MRSREVSALHYPFSIRRVDLHRSSPMQHFTSNTVMACNVENVYQVEGNGPAMALSWKVICHQSS